MKMDVQQMSGSTHEARSTLRVGSRVHFFSMVRGDWMKMMWLRSTWIMLAVLVCMTALATLIEIRIADVRHLLLSNPVQFIESYELSINFLIYRVFSGFLILMVAALTFGLEYQQGTIRVILGRGVGRMKFLFSKMSALFLFALLVTLGGIVFNGFLLIVIVGVSTGSLTALGVILSHCMGSLAQFFLYLLFNMCISILLATAATILGRSLTFGLTVALLWFPTDNFASLFGPLLLNKFFSFDIVMKIINALLGPALNALEVQIAAVPPTHSSVSYMFVPAITPGVWPTVAVIFVYAFAFLGLSITLICRRDIQ